MTDLNESVLFDLIKLINVFLTIKINVHLGDVCKNTRLVRKVFNKGF